MYPTLGTILEQTVQKYPTQEALVDRGKQQRWTYAEWNQVVNQLANALTHAGVRKGDVVSTVLSNRSEFVTSLFACAKIGAIFNPINDRLKSKEIAYIVRDCKPRVLIFEQAVENEVRPIFYQFPMTLFWNVDYTEQLGGQNFQGFVAQAPSYPPLVDVKEDDIYALLYTSGSTGKPKGVMHRHRDMIEQSAILSHALKLTSQDRGLCVAPLYHCAELHCMLIPRVHVGATNVLLPTFDPQLVLQAVREEQISVLFGEPAMWSMLLSQIEKRPEDPISSLRIGLYGTAPMPSSLIRQCKELLGIELIQSYGMTEMGPTITLLFDHEQQSKSGSVGKACLNHEIRIITPGGNPWDQRKSGEVGEIIVRGPCMMAGYFNKQRASEKVLRDGWYYTGDHGYLDEEGYLFVTSRTDDRIISGGENIDPREIEEVLCEHPAVLDVAVVGKRDRYWGERVVAYIVPKHPVESGELDHHCKTNHRLAAYKRPKEYIFVKELPRNASGKIQKFPLNDAI